MFSLLAALLLFSCSKADTAAKPGQAKKAPAVAVEAARQEPISHVLELTGEVAVVESAVISSTVEGRLSFLPWREGDSIEPLPGKPVKLVEIDRELYRAEVKAAEAVLEVAKAKLEDLLAGARPEEIAKAAEAVKQIEEGAAFARTDLERLEKLAESGSVPGEAVEKAQVMRRAEEARLAAAKRHLEMLEAGFTKTAVAVQQALVNEAAARLELAAARSAECVIYAPFKGTVTRVFARAGDMAAARAPLLEISDLSTLVMRTAAPEAYSARVEKGMTAFVTLDALGGKPLRLQISRVFPAIDRTMRARTVEIGLSGVSGAAPGMFARVGIEIERAESAVTVPSQSVSIDPMGGRFVFVVSEGKAEQRKVKTGIEQAGRLQVLSGVSAGEAVVIAGSEKLKNGAEVRVIEPGKPGGKPSGRPADAAGVPQEKKGAAE